MPSPRARVSSSCAKGIARIITTKAVTNSVPGLSSFDFKCHLMQCPKSYGGES